jgi:hypothetical protein
VRGKAVVENPAPDMQLEYAGIQGFLKDKIWRMRKFYLAITI